MDYDDCQFEVPGGGPLKLPTCGCILLNAPGREHPWNAKGKLGADAIRPYTPISDSDVVDGKFELLIKRFVDLALQ